MTHVLLIHSAGPQSRPVGIIVFAHVVCSYVRPSPLFKSNQTKQTENNFRYWRDCGFGRVDHCQDFLVVHCFCDERTDTICENNDHLFGCGQVSQL